MKSGASLSMCRHTLGSVLLIVLAFLESVDATRPILRRVKNNNSKVFIYVAFAIFLFGLFLAAGWCAREFCPRGPIFTPLELDEIRLERLDDIESSLKSSINNLKTKLAFHRKKKTQVQTDRDIKRRLGERVEEFNDRGRSIYGEAWDQGDIPVEDVVAMTTKEVEGLRREADVIIKERKTEEKEDLWKLWNEMRQDKPSASNNAESSDAASQMKRGSEVTAGPKKMQYTSSNHSIAESIARMNAANVNISNGYNNPNTHVTKPSATFELKDGKFDQPQAQSYSYNNNNYSYADPAPSLSRPASQMRMQPPILDLSKLTAPPAHIKPPSKPPPVQLQNPMHMRAMSNINNPNNSATAGAGVDRDSVRPTMRAFPPGKRPPPPAGPKPNRSNPADPSSNEAIDRLAYPSNIHTPPTKHHGNTNGNGVQTMRRPPPPLLAPPPGYIPGNSSKGGRNPALRASSARMTVTETHEKDR